MANKKQKLQKNQLTKPKQMKMVEEYIEASQELLAALAWNGYKTVGRGFVLVVLEDNNELNALYVWKNHELWDVFQSNFSNFHQIIADYDPKTQVVIVSASRKYTQIGVGTFDMPPPIAYIKHQDDFA